MSWELFPSNDIENILPHDGEVFYHSDVFSESEREDILDKLIREIDWEKEKLVMFGRKIVMSRKVAWFSDDDISYSYSGTTRKVHCNIKLIQDLRQKACELTGEEYNSCLANLYHDGSESMGWHADDEKGIVRGSSIASLSFGAVRKFAFKHRQTKETISLQLGDGSLLDMRGEVQQHWVHQLPKTKRVNEVRVNLTFRKIRSV